MAQVSPQPETSTGVPLPAVSPPPNCAICLGNCKNRCYSDSCMHQFCFKCLLEWSKIKPVCPLCKQHFNSIIHTIKASNDYEEHFIHRQVDDEDGEGYNFYLPTVPASRHFQFRTTFTVDPRGELAIQQLLSTHPLTNSFYEYLGSRVINTAHARSRRLRRDVSSTQYRRTIYANDMWANAPRDVSGSFRDITPQYYRENPAARNRLVPWLNRELNALLHENTQHVMHVVDVILGALLEHHIRSRVFKQILTEYFAENTDHFIHEFYNYMRSLYDMIGYDRQIFYTHAAPYLAPVELSSSTSDSDSDVDISVTSIMNRNRNLLNRPILEVIEINSDSSHDSDVIYREPTPPVVVDLLNTDSSDDSVILSQEVECNNDSVDNKPVLPPLLPLKIRLKHKRQSRESKKSKRLISTSSESDTCNSDSESNRKKRYKRKRKHRRHRMYKIVKNGEISSSTTSSDDEPLSTRQKKMRETKIWKIKRKHNKSKVRRSYLEMKQETDTHNENVEENDDHDVNSTSEKHNKRENNYTPPMDEDEGNARASKSETSINSSYNDRENNPGPSNGKLHIILKNEANMWYSRPCAYNSDSSD